MNLAYLRIPEREALCTAIGQRRFLEQIMTSILLLRRVRAPAPLTGPLRAAGAPVPFDPGRPAEGGPTSLYLGHGRNYSEYRGHGGMRLLVPFALQPRIKATLPAVSLSLCCLHSCCLRVSPARFPSTRPRLPELSGTDTSALRRPQGLAACFPSSVRHPQFALATYCHMRPCEGLSSMDSAVKRFLNVVPWR